MQKFLALSRTSHGILELGAPGFVAILWSGGFPEIPIILLSLFTAFAGYTAIYALNDLVGIEDDREKFVDGEIKEGYSVEASELRYPLARGVVTYREGWLWFGLWFIAALLGAYILNPFIVYILLAAAVLEVVYCRLLKVTHWRMIASGFVKSSGPIAAIFVVDPDPAPQFVLLILAWFFFWEIGGQNVPADWNDTEEDERVGAKTIPLLFGFQSAGRVVLVMLGLTFIVSLFLPSISPLNLGWPYLVATALVGYFLLLRPGYELYRCQEGRCAAELFDHASYYPLAHLGIITVFALIAL